MNKIIKEIIVLGVLVLAMAWSVWYFTNYPETYPPAQEITQRCGDEEKEKPYCVGFGHGYDWALSQMRMDEAMNGIIKEELKK